MRRTTLAPLAGAFALVLTLAACGDDDAEPATSAPDATTIPPDATTIPPDGTTIPEVSLVPTTPASVPDVSIPASIPTELVVTELTPGSGPEAQAGDIVFVNYVGVRSEDGEQFDTNYGGQPFAVTIGAGGVIAGWDQGLVGVTAGERLQLDIPNDLAYADQAQGDIIQPGDALTFVIDVAAVVPPPDAADAPADEEIPLSSELVDEAVVEDLVEGDGTTLEPEMTGVFQLVAARGDNGEVLDNTWETGQPQVFEIVEGQLLPGLIDGLPGMKVGGRRAITIPYDPAMSLPAPETNVVIVADLVAAF